MIKFAAKTLQNINFSLPVWRLSSCLLFLCCFHSHLKCSIALQKMFSFFTGWISVPFFLITFVGFKVVSKTIVVFFFINKGTTIWSKPVNAPPFWEWIFLLAECAFQSHYILIYSQFKCFEKQVQFWGEMSLPVKIQLRCEGKTAVGIVTLPHLLSVFFVSL